MMVRVEFARVSKRFGAIQALNDVTFAIAPGETVALLGPNGAGKTTALELLLGLRNPDSGSVRLCGGSPRSAHVRRMLGATPQNTGFPDALRAREIAAFVAANYPDPLAVDTVFRDFDLTEIADRRLGELSGGQQRRVAVALAFVGNPEVVVLDEPTTGLDAESRHRLWQRLARKSERSVLFTTHYIEEAQASASRVIVIDRGSVLFDGGPGELRERFGRKRIEYVGSDGPVVAHPEDADRFVRDLVAAQTPFRELTIAVPSLEEAFLAMTGAQR